MLSTSLCISSTGPVGCLAFFMLLNVVHILIILDQKVPWCLEGTNSRAAQNVSHCMRSLITGISCCYHRVNCGNV